MIKTRIEDCRFPDLIYRARKAMENSYSPYSNYKVGAAVLTDDGRIFTGCNIENGSYSATVCAERTAVFKAISEGAKKIAAIAIASEEGSPTPFPCGICRQVFTEFCDPGTPVMVFDGGHSVYDFTLDNLIPFSFNL